MFSSKDSARINSMIENIKREKGKKKFIVAVYPYLNSYKGVHHKYFMKDCSEYNDVMDKLVGIKDSLKIDINKIITKKNDSIIYFKKELLSKNTKEYIKFDFFISFSRIAFNNDFTKAVVKVSASRSKLAGFSAIYFLEKKIIYGKLNVLKGFQFHNS